jgi:hypothetical protein
MSTFWQEYVDIFRETAPFLAAVATLGFAAICVAYLVVWLGEVLK